LTNDFVWKFDQAAIWIKKKCDDAMLLSKETPGETPKNQIKKKRQNVYLIFERRPEKVKGHFLMKKWRRRRRHWRD
jgi:hypothetical protein